MSEQVAEALEARRAVAVAQLAAELVRIATPKELNELVTPTEEEVYMPVEKPKKTGIARSAAAAKLGVTMTGVDKVGQGAMAIARRPFPAGSKTREFLDTDEGRHIVLGLLAFVTNLAAEMDSVPIDADNIAWVTEAQIANSAMHLSSSAVDVGFDKLLGVGSQLLEFAMGLKQPESMADVINMTRHALEVENAILDTGLDAAEKAKATVPAKAAKRG